MALISSVSGIRGTIGGTPGNSLTPMDIVKYATAYATWVKNNSDTGPTVIVGRDARISGEMVSHLVIGSLMGMGIHIVDLGLATTPTVEMAVVHHRAQGGIILTASHNPMHWNALKLLNDKGEFLSKEAGATIMELAEHTALSFPESTELGTYGTDQNALEQHIAAILKLPIVDVEAIKKAHFSIGVDSVNSVGGLAVPLLLERLGVDRIEQIYDEPHGHFQRVAEPLVEHLTGLGELVREHRLDLGIAVDPDVDRLALVAENGVPIGEENTLVLVADHILSQKSGPLVANMSSTMALQDIAQKHGVPFFESPVGEVHVVKAMKNHHAVIGGEGNGGVICPELHYGRDALVGIAIVLTLLAKEGQTLSALVDRLPKYVMEKTKMELSEDVQVEQWFAKIKASHTGIQVNEEDGLKIYYPNGWIQLRKSNTEPIVRLYAEHREPSGLAAMITEIRNLVSGS